MRLYHRPQRTARQRAGSLAKANGKSAEEVIETLAAYYLSEGLAELTKRYEPYRRVGNAVGGFRAVYAGQAGCDYELWLPDGRAGHVEVKSREADRIEKSAIDPFQQAQLQRRIAWGQLAIVLVRLRGEWFYVPFSRWHEGKRLSHNIGQLYEIGVKLNEDAHFLSLLDGR